MFIDEVHDYQSFVVNHLYLLGDQYQLIQEQFHIRNAIIDILLYNIHHNCLTIVELKNPIATNKAVTQITKYFQYLKNTVIDNYDIVNIPECFIVAPKFTTNIVLPDMPNIQLLKLDNDTTEFINLTDQYHYSSVMNSSIKKKPTLLTENSILDLSDKLISSIQCLYEKQLIEIRQDNKISLLDKKKKLVAKIIIPYDWFANELELILYNRFIKDFNTLSFQYDACIKNTKHYQTMVKLLVNDVPNFLLERN